MVTKYFVNPSHGHLHHFRGFRLYEGLSHKIYNTIVINSLSTLSNEEAGPLRARANAETAPGTEETLDAFPIAVVKFEDSLAAQLVIRADWASRCRWWDLRCVTADSGGQTRRATDATGLHNRIFRESDALQMVLLTVKRSDDQQQFLADLPADTPVEKAINVLTRINNLRHRIHRLRLEGVELCKYGPAKDPACEGIDHYQAQPVKKGEFYQEDPTGRRTGNAAHPQAAETLMKTLEVAEHLVRKEQVALGAVTTAAALEAALDEVRGGVMIAYPMGLPAWDRVRQAIEDTEDLAGTPHATEDLDANTAELWFAGKLMERNRTLGKFVGRHARTKAVVRLQAKDAGPPVREQALDAETQKSVMAWYYRKQEEEKRLADHDELDYYHSAWADPKALKHAFSGIGNIKIR